MSFYLVIINFELPIRNYYFEVLRKFMGNIVKIVGIKEYIIFRLPNKRKTFKILKSPHIYKKSFETFEKITSNVCCYIYLYDDFKKFEKLNKFFCLINWSFIGFSVKYRLLKKNYIII